MIGAAPRSIRELRPAAAQMSEIWKLLCVLCTAPHRKRQRTVGAALDGSHARCRPVTAPPTVPPSAMAASELSNRPYFAGGAASDMAGTLCVLCTAPPTLARESGRSTTLRAAARLEHRYATKQLQRR